MHRYENAAPSLRSLREGRLRAGGPYRRSRHGRVQVLTVLLLLALIVAGFFAQLFGPYYLDYMNMKEVVKSASLAWYANAEEVAGREKLRMTLDQKEIDYITGDDCSFEKQGEYFVVSCAWVVHVYYPGTDYYKTLDYSVTASSDQRGSVEVY